MTTQEILQAAKAAKGAFAAADTATRDRALEAMADALLADREAILAANEQDLEALLELLQRLQPGGGGGYGQL